MADRVDDFVRAVDRVRDYAVVAVDRASQAALEDIDALMRSADARDEDLWAELKAPDGDTSLSLEADKDRDLDWVLAFAGLSAAATTQFFLENATDLIVKPLAYQEQTFAGFSLSQTELVAAGKRGTLGLYTETLTTNFEAIRAEYLRQVAFIGELPPTELYRLLGQYDALVPYERMVADAAGYVARMTSYPPGSPQFKQAVSDLVNKNSTRGLKAMNRRAVERIWTDREVDGSPTQKLVWIGEGGKNTCSYCLDNFGIIKTYAEWEADGLPGADVCAGGDFCQCFLAAV